MDKRHVLTPEIRNPHAVRALQRPCRCVDRTPMQALPVPPAVHAYVPSAWEEVLGWLAVLVGLGAVYGGSYLYFMGH